MSTTDKWVSTPITPAFVHGALEFESTSTGLLPHRIPAWARRQAADPQLDMVESQPSGVRLAFDTEADAIELDARATRRLYVGLPPLDPGIYDLRIDGEPAGQSSVDGGRTLRIDMMAGTMEIDDGPAGTIRFAGLPRRAKRVEIWLPHNETTELVALRANAPVATVEPAKTRRWLHHGSSISHGSNATHPAAIWPTVAAAHAGLSLTNLGLGGSAMVDPFMARILRDQPADLISVKLGINVVNGDVMRRRAFGPAVHGFLDTIREGKQNIPIILVSPIFCPIHETTPGPCAPDIEAMKRGERRFIATGSPEDTKAGRLSLEIIREMLAHIAVERQEGDPNLFYLDGLDLYGATDSAAYPLPDQLHPDTATQELIGERFARHPVVQQALADLPS